MSAEKHTRNMLLAALGRLNQLDPAWVRKKLKDWGFAADAVVFRTTNAHYRSGGRRMGGRPYTEVKRWPWGDTGNNAATDLRAALREAVEIADVMLNEFPNDDDVQRAQERLAEIRVRWLKR